MSWIYRILLYTSLVIIYTIVLTERASAKKVANDQARDESKP
jgi:hypothetical protein